jgi:hypothetical protein
MRYRRGPSKWWGRGVWIVSSTVYLKRKDWRHLQRRQQPQSWSLKTTSTTITRITNPTVQLSITPTTLADSGCTDCQLPDMFGFSDVPRLLFLSYLQQLRQVFHKFILKHADEFVCFAEMDSHNTLSLHAGPSPRDGSGWIRVNGRGIAQPGLRKGTVGLSETMRKDMGQMCLFLVEILLRKMMKGSNREKQCVPDECQIYLNDIWRKYLSYPLEIGDQVARMGEGLTLHIGLALLLHYDYLNDRTHLIDNISWLTNIVEDFSTHISPSSFTKCVASGVSLQNVPITFLAYTRSIIGSQARKLKNAASVQCNLFKNVLRQIALDYQMDTERLEDESFRKLFLLKVTKERKLFARNSKNPIQANYTGHICRVKETNNRHIFHGSFLYVWDRFVTIRMTGWSVMITKFDLSPLSPLNIIPAHSASTLCRI